MGDFMSYLCYLLTFNRRSDKLVYITHSRVQWAYVKLLICQVFEVKLENAL